MLRCFIFASSPRLSNGLQRTFSSCNSLLRTNTQRHGNISPLFRRYDQFKSRPSGPCALPGLPSPSAGGRVVPTRAFRTSQPRQFHPIFWIFAKPAAKVVSIISGRSLRKAFQNLPKEQQTLWRKRIKLALPYIIGGIIGLSVANYYMHIQETPITKRKRYIAFTPDQFMKIAQFEYEMQMESVKDQVIKPTHPYYKRMERVVSRLVNANQDIDLLKKQTWTLILVESPERNAFVLPTGHIFVYTGLMNTVQNEDQLAVVMGHEMAHAILMHGAERVSMANFIDSIVILVLGALWFFVPSDGIAVVTHWFFNKVVSLLLNLPYDRKLETEADDVGMELIAKACYDVRESCNFWDLMKFLNETESDQAEVPEWFSTHPSNESRVMRLEEMIPKALNMRDMCRCPKLSERDPRRILQHMKAIIRDAEEPAVNAPQSV